MKVCNECGTLSADEAKFCINCGKKLEEAEAAAEVAEAAAEETAEEIKEETETAAEAAEAAAEEIKEETETAAESVAEEVKAAEPVIIPAVEPADTPVDEPAAAPSAAPVVSEEPAQQTQDTAAEPQNAEELSGPGQKYNRPVKGRVFGIIGFVLALEALVYSWIPFVGIFTLIQTIVALIFCGISKKNANFKLGRVGSVLGWIALGLSIAFFVASVLGLIFGIAWLIKSGEWNDIVSQLRNSGIYIN